MIKDNCQKPTANLLQLGKRQVNSVFYVGQNKHINSIHSPIHFFTLQQIVIGPLLYSRHNYMHWRYNSKQKRQKTSALIDIMLGRKRSKKKKRKTNWYKC